MIRETIEEITELGVDMGDKDSSIQIRVGQHAVNLIDFSEDQNGRPPSTKYIVDLLQGMDAFAFGVDANIQIRTFADVAQQNSVQNARTEFNTSFQALINQYDASKMTNPHKPSTNPAPTSAIPAIEYTSTDSMEVGTTAQGTNATGISKSIVRPSLMVVLPLPGNTLQATHPTSSAPEGVQNAATSSPSLIVILLFPSGTSQIAQPPTFGPQGMQNAAHNPNTIAATAVVPASAARPRKPRVAKVPSVAWTAAERATLRTNWGNRAGKSRQQIETEHLTATGIQRSYDGLRQQMK